MNNKEYEKLKFEIKKLFDHLTYEEQEMIIDLVRRLIDRRDHERREEENDGKGIRESDAGAAGEADAGDRGAFKG